MGAIRAARKGPEGTWQLPFAAGAGRPAASGSLPQPNDAQAAVIGS